MIINSAMINSKDVLEMKLNNSIVYSTGTTPVQTAYNYYFQHSNSNIPTWIKSNLLFNYYNNGFHFQSDSMPYGMTWFTNTTSSGAGGQAIGYLLLDLTGCTTGLKIEIYSYYRVIATRHGAAGYIHVFNNTSATTVGTITGGRTLGAYNDTYNGTYNTGSVTLTQAEIATYKYFAIRFYINGGATTGSTPALHVKDVTFTQV